MKRLICCTLFFLILNVSRANEVKVSVEPRQPVAGERFQLIFDITMQEAGEPFISFEPSQAEVIGRTNLGTSVQTTIINGQVTTKRSVRYAYDLVVANPGMLRISDIAVEINGQTKRLDGLTVTILRERRAPAAYFLEANLEKDTAYVGEGLTLNYYLYFRVPIVGTEVRDFPKLNNLIKRFHLPSERVETVEVNGVLYRRQVAYTARIYPEKPGELIIDPLKLRIQYSDQPTTGSAFSGFGFQSRQTQVRNIQSEELTINVLPLPLEGLPKNFTGLVGQHEFNLIMPRSRFLVNEPVEVRLEVVGGGALENMNAPVIFDNESLEQFDTLSDFAEIDRERAKKNFEYTFLARSPLQLEASKLSLNYFDPDTKQYVSVPLDIPEIIVSGGAAASSPVSASELKSPSGQTALRPNIVFGVTAPFFTKLSLLNSSKSLLNLGNIVLALGIFAIAIWSVLGFALSLQNTMQGEEIVREMRKKGITYSNFYKLMDLYNVENKNISLAEYLKSLELSEDAKKYFVQVYDQLEKSSFDERKTPISFKFSKKYFYELLRTLNTRTF